MVKEETIDFLIKVPPLNMLTREELGAVVEDVSLEYYPKGARILAQNGPPSDYLRIIKKGGVRVYMESPEAEDVVIDYRSEGEHFGLLSLISGDRSRANVMAVEDTICYLVPRENVLSLIQKHPEMNEYFLKSFFFNFIDKAYDDTRKRHESGTGMGVGDRLLFTTSVGDIVTKAPVTAPAPTTIQGAARVMAGNKISSLIVVDSSGVPQGIITDRDLREKVVAGGMDITEPVSGIMSSPLIKADAEEQCFETLLRMMRYKIHHIIVMEDDSMKGIVTNHDFMVLQGSSPTVLVREVGKMRTLESLGGTTTKLYKTVSSLLREGARSHNITGLITELADKLVNRLADLMEEKIGPAPLKSSIFLYCDGGRRELALDLGMKLGVVYEDTSNLGLIKETEGYFSQFISGIEESLAFCNSRAEGGGCLRVSDIKSVLDWKDTFSRWADPSEDIRLEPGVFDMRSMRGSEEMVYSLRDYLFETASARPHLLDALATDTVLNKPPLGFFRRFVVEKSGEHKNKLDLYEKGIKPIMASVRLLAVKLGIRELSTFRRLEELRGHFNISNIDEIIHAFEYLMTVLVHNQLERVESGRQPDSFINPEELSNLERKSLKESFMLITELYETLERNFHIGRL
jgi:CBS domain-containing protein